MKICKELIWVLNLVFSWFWLKRIDSVNLKSVLWVAPYGSSIRLMVNPEILAKPFQLPNLDEKIFWIWRLSLLEYVGKFITVESKANSRTSQTFEWKVLRWKEFRVNSEIRIFAATHSQLPSLMLYKFSKDFTPKIHIESIICRDFNEIISFRNSSNTLPSLLGLSTN